MLSRKPLPAGVASTPITFPSPNPSSFAVVKKSRQGHPQVRKDASWLVSKLHVDFDLLFICYIT